MCMKWDETIVKISLLTSNLSIREGRVLSLYFLQNSVRNSTVMIGKWHPSLYKQYNQAVATTTQLICMFLYVIDHSIYTLCPVSSHQSHLGTWDLYKFHVLEAGRRHIQSLTMKECRFYILNTIPTPTRHTDTSLLTYLFRPSGDLQGVEDVLQICCILLRAVTISSLAFTASRASLRCSCSFLPSVRLDKTLSLASISLWAQEYSPPIEKKVGVVTKSCGRKRDGWVWSRRLRVRTVAIYSVRARKFGGKKQIHG